MKTLQQITNRRKEYLASKIRALDFARELKYPKDAQGFMDLDNYSEISPTQFKMDKMRDFYRNQLITLINGCIKSVNGNILMPHPEKLKIFNLFGVW